MQAPVQTHLAEPVLAYVGLGANLGPARQTLQAALAALDRCPGTQCLRRSSWYRSAPVQAVGPDFLNLVVELRTWLGAPALLDHLQAIERAAGRVRPYPNAPRSLDLDLLHYGSARVQSPALVLPHPRWQERAFVLLPLAELVQHWVHDSWLAAVAGQAIDRLDAGPVSGPFAAPDRTWTEGAS